jgi:hypothetical protein
MEAINSTLAELIVESEGRYLTSAQLQPIERYLQTFTERFKTYEILQAKAEPLVRHALKKFATLHPDVMQKHGKRCHYDMSQVLRYIALAILRDDPRFFNDSMVLWETNILTAYHRQNSCLVAYRCLKETMETYLPPQALKYIEPYLEMMFQALDLPPKLMATVQKSAVGL